MADRVIPEPVDGAAGIREAVCVHTRKIFDSCRDKDCVEDLPVWPTACSEPVIAAAAGIRPRACELLGVHLNVDAISFNRGFYTVDVRYWYRIRGEAYPISREVEGLAVFDKRVILFGSEGSSKQFSSERGAAPVKHGAGGLPIAVVDAVDPIALRMSLAETCEPCPAEIPESVSCCFDTPVATDVGGRRWLVTLGQFSIIRLERDVQLLLPGSDYCVPEKECFSSPEDDPCAMFGRIRFPMEEFCPPDDVPEADAANYRDAARTLC